MTIQRICRRILRQFGYDVLPLKNLGFEDQKTLLGRQAQIVVDVGAAVGKTARIYRDLFPETRLLLLEPHPESFEILQQRIAGDARAAAFNVAASDSQGKCLFHLNHSPDASSLLASTDSHRRWLTNREAERAGAIEVETVTLDRFCEQQSVAHVDVLKIDVQGAELRVLGGAAELLSSARISLIYAEVNLVKVYEGQAMLHDVVVFLDRFGYRLYNLYDLSLKMNTGRLMWADALFTRQ